MVRECLKLNSELIHKAIHAILCYIDMNEESKHLLKKKTQFIQLVISLKKLPHIMRREKPRRLNLPHPIYHLIWTKVCLFVKDYKKNKECISKHCSQIKVIKTSKLHE